MTPYKSHIDTLYQQRWWSTYIESLSGQEAFTSVLDVYRGIVEDTRTGSICQDDVRHLCLNDTLAVDLMEIERFMRYTLYGPFDTALKNSRGEPHRDGPEQRYRLYFYKLFFHWTWLDVSLYVVSPLVRLFFETLDYITIRFLHYFPHEVPLVWSDHPQLILLDHLCNGRLRNHSDLYDLVVHQVRVALEERAGETFQRQSARRILLALRHYRACCNFVQRLLEQVPKVWISRLEFGYDQAMTPKPGSMAAFGHLRRLIETELAGAHGNDHLGYLWHADYNPARGYVFQVFWFDRTDPKQQKLGDEAILQRLAHLWSQDITQGSGYALDCAESPSPYKHQFESELSGPRSLIGSSLDWTLLHLFRKPLYFSVRGIYSQGINMLPTLSEHADIDRPNVLR